MDIQYIKQHKSLTLEYGRGETYCNGKPTLYGHSVYGRGSVLAGQRRRVWLEDWDNLEEAQQSLKAAGIRFTDLCDTRGSTHVPVATMTAHLPDDDF